MRYTDFRLVLFKNRKYMFKHMYQVAPSNLETENKHLLKFRGKMVF